MSEFRESLRSKGYAPVPIAITREDMQTTMDSYLEFLDLGEELHSKTRYDLHQRGDSDYGQYTRTAGSVGERGIVADSKDIFHFGAQSRQVVESRHRGPLPACLRLFLSNVEELFWEAERTKLCAIDELDVLAMGLRRTMFDDRAPINDVLRLIAYYPNPDKLAKGHFDRSVCTLAIGESHEGLRIAPGQNGVRVDATAEYIGGLDQTLNPVAHHEGEAKFFLGAGWNRLEPQLRFGNQDMPLGWHDVIPSDKSVNERIMRWAIVLFANPHLGVDAYSIPCEPETRPYKQFGVLAVA